MSVTRHLLTLTACFLLALPTGWCCYFPLSLPRSVPAAKADADCCRTCCPPCCPPRKEKQPDAPARAPMTVCCCENHVPLPDDGSAKVTPDTAVAPLLTADAPPLGEDHFLRKAFALCLSPPRAIHVLQCLWLC